MMSKNITIKCLLFVLIVILAINPKTVYKMYSSILGRFFLVAVVFFLSMNNVTLGLLGALTIISALNQLAPFTEGFQENDLDGEVKNTLDDNISGVDKENIKQTISSKASNSIPVEQNITSSEETDAFTSGMLNSSKLDVYNNFAPV